MAELLIYDKDHWMDALTPQEVATRNLNDASFQSRYDSRWVRGNVIEIQPDGFWYGHLSRSYDQKNFRLLVCPGKPVSECLFLLQPLEAMSADSQAGIILKQRVYRVTTGETDKIKIVNNWNAVKYTT